MGGLPGVNAGTHNGKQTNQPKTWAADAGSERDASRTVGHCVVAQVTTPRRPRELRAPLRREPAPPPASFPLPPGGGRPAELTGSGPAPRGPHQDRDVAGTPPRAQDAENSAASVHWALAAERSRGWVAAADPGPEAGRGSSRLLLQGGRAPVFRQGVAWSGTPPPRVRGRAQGEGPALAEGAREAPPLREWPRRSRSSTWRRGSKPPLGTFIVLGRVAAIEKT